MDYRFDANAVRIAAQRMPDVTFFLAGRINREAKDAVESLTAIVKTERARRHGAPQDPETARMTQLADKCRQTNATDRLYPVLASFGLLGMHATRA